MSGILSKWSVLQEHPVSDADLDDDGSVRGESLERWIAAATSAYLAQVPALQHTCETAGAELQISGDPPATGALPGRPAQVVVSATATEFFPTSFTLSLRIRSVAGTDDRSISASCEVRCIAPGSGTAVALENDVRDEIIALEHAARHYN
jgi:hypothetical protein